MERHELRTKLKAYRLSRLWTFRELSEATGINIQTLHKIETGGCMPTDLTVAKLLRAIPDLKDVA